MNLAKISQVPAEEWSSPGGKYQLFRQNVSLALGGIKDVGEWGGGHPFDVELARLPPGKSNFPLHKHSAQTELYLILEGRGMVHTEGDPVAIEAGNALHCPPGDAHRIENTGMEDLVYYVIADNPRADVGSYPESPGKIFLKPDRKCVRVEDTEYFEPGD